jgi:type I restriction enzyme R subunit
MNESEEARLAAEQRARVAIDRQLKVAGWLVQDRATLNLFAPERGIAVRSALTGAFLKVVRV